jgi:ABC-2 type transport system ATP-binding protein
MDEPTSGLDPIFRRELLDILQDLMVNENQTIFLSTHITNDLDRIADYIVFIYKGKILFQKSMDEIRDSFHVVKGAKNMIDEDTKGLFTGLQITDIGFQGLYEGNPTIFETFGDEVVVEKANLEDIMFLMTRKEE